MNGDKLATVTGGIIAAVASAQPVLNAVGQGSLHQQDYIQLAIAVMSALFGWFSEFKKKG